MQIRGAHGEHTETNDHIYDISNKRRLGLSEVELVQDMYNGVKAMIEAEKELNGSNKEPSETTACGPQLKAPEDIVHQPKFPAGTTSLLSKCLTTPIWNELKDKEDKYGVSFRQCILSGC